MEARSLLLAGPHELVWHAEQLPPLALDQVLVRSRAGAISMGSELALYRGTARHTRPLAYPRMTGYETVAEVLACGSARAGLATGDRVVTFSGHRTYDVIAAQRAIPVPLAVPDPLALLVILGCETAKGIGKVAIQPGERVLIAGAGTMGLLTLFNLRARGIAAVDLVEPVAERHALAYQLGAQAVVTPAVLAGHEATYHVGIECSGAQAGFAQLQALLVPQGRLCVLADARQAPLALTPAFHEKELHVIGSSDGSDYAGYAAWYWKQLPAYGPALARLFTHEVAFEELPRAFAELARRAVPPVKVLVRYPRDL